jgi:hypothetical protein
VTGGRAWRRPAIAAACALLVSCYRGPAPPDWELDSKAAIDRSVAAYLSGDAALAAREFDLGRQQIARTGRADLVARAELIRCAARVASLQFDACDGFEKLRAMADPPDRAYADFLAARLRPQDLDLLPRAQRAAAGAASSPDTAGSALRAIEDPFSRLVAAAVLFETGRANPAAISLAVDTASAQGWRRPLLAWLNVQAARAEKAGALDEAQRLRRRIGLVQGTE